MKKWYLLLSVLLIGIGLTLRLWKFENRAPFDWDQNRDYQTIAALSHGKMTLIGPVAKGEGGFFLGPLYYYLVTPAMILMHGNPRALPLTSIVIDMLSVVAVLVLLPSRLGRKQSLLVAALWTFSWFAIEMSRISWNVALVPLWSVITLWLLSHTGQLSLKKVMILGLVAGLSWHIHAALIPLAVVLVIIFWRRLSLQPLALVLFTICYLIPLIPLVLFDIRHAWLNWHLMQQMFTGSLHAGFSLQMLAEAIFLRLGKNTQSLLTGISNYNILLGYLTLIIALCGLFARQSIYKVASVMIILNVMAVFYLKELGFPEYYFAMSYFPTLILVLYFLTKIVRSRLMPLAVIVGLLVIQNMQHYTMVETSFSLSRKESLSQEIANLHTPVDLRLELAPGREGGIIPLVQASGGIIDPKSPVKVLVTDKTDGARYVNGELATDIGYFGGIRLLKVIIEK